MIRQKRIVILGSTGSIGRQALEVIRALPEYFRVFGLAAGSNLTLLAEQVAEFKPEFVYYESGGKLPAGNYKLMSMELYWLPLPAKPG